MKNLAFILFSAFVLHTGAAVAQGSQKKSAADSTVDSYTAFIERSKARIMKNDKSIDSIKSYRDKRLEAIKAKYDKQVAALETKNDAIRDKVKQASPGGWKAVEASINSDMDAFEQFLIRHDADE